MKSGRKLPVLVLACLAGISAVASSQPTVITVPWQGDPNSPHQVFVGGTLKLQGVASGPVALASATWDPGDGTGPIAISVANPRVLELAHVYNGTPGTPYTARLSVTDTGGMTSSDAFRVVVVPKSLDVEVNMAIDHGLWYLHQRMNLSSVGGVPTGFWSNQNTAADTASAIQAFQVHGHRANGDPAENPYVDNVVRGINHVFTEIHAINITAQTAGNPDTNGNGIGLEVTNGNRPVYIGGQVVDAIALSGTPNAVALTGDATTVQGRTYAAIVQDLMDAYYYGQTDSGFSRGGWQYSWNIGADNSACQWMAIGGIAASRQFGTIIPQFVKDENFNFWIPTSQFMDGTNAGNDGRAGYTNTNPIDVNGMNTTPSAVVQMIVDGIPRSDPRFAAAEHFMVRNWTTLTANNRIYGMFAVAKSMRLALPTPISVMTDGLGGTLDWYRSDTQAGAAVDGLARVLVSRQQPTGRWDGSGWVVNDLATAWAVIILAPNPVQLGPIAVCDAEPERTAATFPVVLSGVDSFHLDPARRIVSYEWDFTHDGIIDATGQTVTTSYASTGTYEVALHVTDDSNPPLTDTVTCCVDITPPPFPPNSNPGSTYHFCLGVNEPFVLDGSASSDPDGTIVAYDWDFDPQPLDLDFNDASGATVDVTAYFTALGPGTYDVGLRVTDDLTNPDTDFTRIIVHDAADCPAQPQADFQMDIRPLECPNYWRKSRTDYFHLVLMTPQGVRPQDVVLRSLRLARADGIGMAAKPSAGQGGSPGISVVDVTTPFNGGPCNCHIMGTDGIPDLSMWFAASTVRRLQLDRAPDFSEVELVLTGQLQNGTRFEARDCIYLLPAR